MSSLVRRQQKHRHVNCCYVMELGSIHPVARRKTRVRFSSYDPNLRLLVDSYNTVSNFIHTKITIHLQTADMLFPHFLRGFQEYSPT